MKKVLISTLSAALLLIGASSSVYAGGCSCKPGYTKVVGNSGVLICQKRVTKKIRKKASCDTSWVIDTDARGKEDRCNWTLGWGVSGRTVPQGTSGIFGPAENYGWALHTYTGRDYWTKNEVSYRQQVCLSN